MFLLLTKRLKTTLHNLIEHQNPIQRNSDCVQRNKSMKQGESFCSLKKIVSRKRQNKVISISESDDIVVSERTA